MIEKVFTADIDNFGSRLNVSLEKSITEAVVNSIQANADSIQVVINSFEDGTLKSIEIVDNGDGFNDVNLDSFFRLHSKLKKDIGGKGVGRASWLKYFKRVSIDSIASQSGMKLSVCFSLEAGPQKTSVKREEVDNGRNLVTKVVLDEYKGDKLYNIRSENLKKYIIRELVVMFFNIKRTGGRIEIDISEVVGGALFASSTIRNEDIPSVEKEFVFSLLYQEVKHEFTLMCIHVETSSNNKVTTGFIAGERSLSDFNTALGIQIHAPLNRYTGQYWILLSSSLFNDGKYTTEGRDRIVFPDGPDLWSGKSLKSEIKNLVLSCVNEYFSQIEPDYEQTRKAVLEEIVELYPQYSALEYQSKIDEILLTTAGRLDRHAMLSKLHELEFDKEDRIKREITRQLKNKNVDSMTIDHAVAFAQNTTEQAKGVLANYFWYRKAIIEQLNRYVDDNEKSEQLLHELFFERNKTQDSASLRNCIWLLDDKFMRFSYFASEAVVSSIVKDLEGSALSNFNLEKRMDLFLKFDKPESAEAYDCVVIEFKGIGSSPDEKINAAMQVVTRYALAIREHLTRVNSLFVYIITEVDAQLDKYIRSVNFKKIYSKYGSIYCFYNEFTDAHIYFVSTSTIVGDASDRHELFFMLLKEELTTKKRWD